MRIEPDKPYKYPLPQIPPYQPVEYKGLSISPKPLGTKHGKMVGHFRIGRFEYTNWVFMERSRIWMSMTPMELESASHHIHYAEGNVLVMGLGMGMWVYNLLLKDEVQYVHVVEKNPKVIELVNRALPSLGELGAKGRLIIENADALAWKKSQLDSHYNFLLVDIWPWLGDVRAEQETLQIQKEARADTIGWWGQEIDFIAYLREIKHHPVDRLGLRKYESHLKAHIVGGDDYFYPTEAYEAARNFIQHQPKGKLREKQLQIEQSEHENVKG